jgi:hypothetical protein
MGVPEKSASLAYNGEVVNIAPTSLYRTLCYICWPISPPSLKLSNAMPILKKIHNCITILNYFLLAYLFRISSDLSNKKKMLPVDGDIVVDMVDHLDKKAVTLPSYNARPRKLSVYCHYALVVAQSCYILQYNLQKIIQNC